MVLLLTWKWIFRLREGANEMRCAPTVANEPFVSGQR